jgi:RND family efflux transporter MFP subunit
MKTYRSLTWFWFFSLITSGNTAAQEAAKLPQVPVAQPAVREVTDYEVFSGRTEAVSRIDLRCRVSGYLLNAPFREGAEVKKGDLLFEIDPRPYRAEMDRADAALALAEARFKLADANHKRATALQNRGVMSAEDLAKIAAERAEAEAAVRAVRAGCDVARLNMEFTRVAAPISGRIGRRLIDPGNIVKADDTHLAVLVSREPMYVYFDVDERSYLRLRRSLRDGGNKVKAGIALAEDSGFRRQGTVDFIDNQVDPATGSLRLRAVLANKDELLTPGMFVRIRLALGSPRQALLVPARAIVVEKGERFVLVVNDKNIVEARPLKLGQEYDGLRVVEAGLKAEDRVVTGGLAKLGPGMTVQPRLEKRPEKQPADLPEEGSASAVPSPRVRQIAGEDPALGPSLPRRPPHGGDHRQPGLWRIRRSGTQALRGGSGGGAEGSRFEHYISAELVAGPVEFSEPNVASESALTYHPAISWTSACSPPACSSPGLPRG